MVESSRIARLGVIGDGMDVLDHQMLSAFGHEDDSTSPRDRPRVELADQGVQLRKRGRSAERILIDPLDELQV